MLLVALHEAKLVEIRIDCYLNMFRKYFYLMESLSKRKGASRATRPDNRITGDNREKIIDLETSNFFLSKLEISSLEETFRHFDSNVIKSAFAQNFVAI